MALFSRKTTEETKTLNVPVSDSRAQDLSWVLLRPRITEKATDMNAARAYVFDVAPSANKTQIKAAVRAVYKVTPVKVRVVSVKAKRIQNARTGVAGTKPGGKKAYVYLKAGEAINIM